MAYKIKDNTSMVLNDFRVKSSIFLRTFAEQVVNDSEKKTPKREGNLRRDVLKQVLGLSGKIIWNKNYAAKMEEIQFRNYTTPGTGPNFAKNAIHNMLKNTLTIAKSSGLI